MRRDKLASQDEELFSEIMDEVTVGYLGMLLPDGTPRSVGLNFAALGHDITFHGALAGEKFELLQHNPAAGFTVVKEYSYIPSNWSAPCYACPATQFFKSVEIRGRCGLVSGPQEKARALQALMEKYQPEGGYDKIDASVPQYAKALEMVGVYRLTTESWTGKIKFGQGEPLKLLRIYVEKLRERNLGMDEATAVEIENILDD